MAGANTHFTTSLCTKPGNFSPFCPDELTEIDMREVGIIPTSTARAIGVLDVVAKLFYGAEVLGT
jgi:hypothetical protein